MWLGRGQPINPYLRAHLIDLLRKSYLPKEWKLYPEDICSEDARDFLEWTTLRGWVKQWLNYLKWYHTVAMSDQVSLEDFFKAPVITYDWKVTRKDPQLVKFGLMWKLYDEVALRGLSYRVPILGASSNPQSNLCLVRGGISGTDFVLAAQDCNQPRAGRGVITLGSDDLPIRTIRYKTLGVLDRQCVVGFQGWDKASGTYSQVMS